MSGEKMVVTRGHTRDEAAWAPLQEGERAPAYEPVPPPPRQPVGPVVFAIVASIAVVLGTWLAVFHQKPSLGAPLVATIADLQAVHAGVHAAGEEVRRTRRLAKGDAVETDDEGRARLRLDDGTSLVLDRATKLTLTAAGVALERGRVFVDGALGAHTAIDLGGGVTAIVSGTTAAIDRRTDAPSVYAPSNDVTVRKDGADTTVHAGETAKVAGGKIAVAPERGFDDWTYGMAVPWSASGEPRRAIGELWGRGLSAPAGDPGSPLTIRSHDVSATITGEVAHTEVRTVYFNGGSDPVLGDFRMAIPSGAIVDRFAAGTGDAVRDASLALADRSRTAPPGDTAALEWAGDGWVRGSLPGIPPGATMTVVVGYTEWLSPRPSASGRSRVVEYRYPMVSDATPPQIGEFSATIDASPSHPRSLAAGLGAEVVGSRVGVRRPDFRPSADLVVDVEIEPWSAPARLYAAGPTSAEDPAGTIVVRTEAPAAAHDAGVTLALVVDSSASVEPALLGAEKALVEAVLSSLGAHDRAVVLAADQSARPLGPATMGPVDGARRKAVSDALATLAPGGATDLGRALESAADAIPADAPAGMVVYVGDGWPTVGDPTSDAILARLSRRAGGAPRLGAVAVGPFVNRLGLAALVHGSGPLLEIADSSDAAKVAVDLVADALQPTVAGVELDLGPDVERVYPRGARAVLAGGTVTAVGRVRGAPPASVRLRYRDAKGVHEETRAVVVERTVDEAEIARRWAALRVEEIALDGRGREAATDVAMRAGLLTPWTGWVVGGTGTYVATPLATRVLDLAGGADAGFTAALATPRGTVGTLVDAPDAVIEDDRDSDDAVKAALAAAATRTIDDAGSAVRACRDARAALRPELGGALDVSLSLDGDGHASDVGVRGESDDDAALDACVKVVVEGLAFPSLGVKVTVKVTRAIALPPPRALRGHKCSATSVLPMPLRRGVWKERLDRAAPDFARVYLEAKDACELPAWTDRRALLELVLLENEDGLARLATARALEDAGEVDAAALLRRETVRRAKSPDELRRIERTLVGDERLPWKAFVKQYDAAGDDGARLAVVRRFLGVAPHDARLRRRLLALLESLKMKQPLADEVRRIRMDPFADASLLADGASALRRIGDEAEAARAFGELAERAPADPWARAFLGDRLRNEGLFDDATAAYAVLEELLPDEPASVIRLALAHAGAGRLDVAERMLARVAATGGRRGDAALGELATRVASVLVAEARTRPNVPADDADRLARAALELPSPRESVVVLLRAPASSLPVSMKVARGPKDAREERDPDVASAALGLASVRLDPSDAGAVFTLKRPEELAPARAMHVRLDALVPDGEGKPPRLVSTEVDLPATGKAVELTWSGSGWSAS